MIMQELVLKITSVGAGSGGGGGSACKTQQPRRAVSLMVWCAVRRSGRRSKEKTSGLTEADTHVPVFGGVQDA